ncbi:hypothetical protein SAMN05443572_108114 [Myxococcus fulvus]|uniref:Lipoprotein n=1 Tax=Myxococcus fulvus TaxID=33 RepID=A0A511T3U8_MYXFU|nr:hypothetical protein [Myxococcus fulvus]GEN08849.1 hypothetical protein MFU01_38860 [Myxococcus fulvus]SEU29000.1 hypothetical protein SAMN05443572_108114 [Myxococcus fulvus]
MSSGKSWLGLLGLSLLLACERAPAPSRPAPEVPEVPEVPAPETRPILRVAYDDEQPAEGILVLLDGVEQGKTDSAGKLALALPSGPFQLELRHAREDGEFAQVTQAFEGPPSEEAVIHLARPVRLLAPLEVTTSSVHLAWQRSHARGFRRYRLYALQHFPTVSATNGLLIHEGDDVARADFNLAGVILAGSPLVAAATDLYFRLYVDRDDGSVTTSNILHVKTPEWHNEALFTRHYTLVPESGFAGRQPIHGVAYDGEALWLVYREELGGFYDDDRLTLTRLDPQTLAVLQAWTFMDHRVPRGLTWDGTSLWLYLEAHERKLVRIDPATGAPTREFLLAETVEALAWTGTHLVSSANKQRGWGYIERLDPSTGGSVSVLPSPFIQRSAHRAGGIAYRTGETWLSDWYVDDLVIVDDEGTHIGVVRDDHHFHHMAFMGDRLVGVTRESQVHLLRIEP